MENNHVGACDEGVLVPVLESSDFFRDNILTPLQSSYLHDESKQCFTYNSAILIKNPVLEEKYDSFRAKRRAKGYLEKDLKESYGFLLFDDADKAKLLSKTGVLTGNSTCTILGEPSKGVYMSMYSDCLDLNCFYHGKSGHIAIIKLTKGKVKEVLENYTQSVTEPSVGFDCHVSEQLSSVSTNTSSFLAFERSQYYLYELLEDGCETAEAPSLACPFAIVSFSYTVNRALEPPGKSEEKTVVCHYSQWKGQLQIDSYLFDVGLRSTTGILIPAKLPAVVKVDRAISMLDLKRLLPKTIFETRFSGEVSLDGKHCSLCELVPSAEEETKSVSRLIHELKKKDLALTVPLNDGGFLVLLDSSHFITDNGIGSSGTGLLYGIFVFPDSRAILRDTTSGQRKPSISSEILQVLPALSYAEGEVDKTPIKPSEELCEIMAQHMQNYAALINPGPEASPSREVSVFPDDQYDLPDAPAHLYADQKWTNKAWQGFNSYLSQPVSFQLPVSRASKILAAGLEERGEDLRDDVYICLSSPEESTSSAAKIESEDQPGCQESTGHPETFVENHLQGEEQDIDSTILPQHEEPNVLPAEDVTKETETPDLTVLNKTDIGAKDVSVSLASVDHPAELIVSITSAERTAAGVTENNVGVISAMSATKHNEIQISDVSTKSVMAQVNSANEADEKQSKPGLQTSVEEDFSTNEKHDQDRQISGHSESSEPSHIALMKSPRLGFKMGRPSPKIKYMKSTDVSMMVKEPQPGNRTKGSILSMEPDAFPLRKKMEHWDLQPINTKCGRRLVPYGYAGQCFKSLKNKQESAKVEHRKDNMLAEFLMKAPNTVEMEQNSGTALETTLEKTATISKEGGNLQNTVVGHAEPSNLRQSGGHGSPTQKSEPNEHPSAKADLTRIQMDSTTCSLVQSSQEKHTDRPHSAKLLKGEIMLRKLKSVLLRGKRKVNDSMSEKPAPSGPHCLKKSKEDAENEMLKSNDTVKTIPGPNEEASAEEVSLSIDPQFAHALGLTPKEAPDKLQNTKSQDPQLRRNLPKIQEQTSLDKRAQPQITQSSPSIPLGKSRMKTLKKRQDIPAESIKKKWWLHFQTPSSVANEQLKVKGNTRDNSVKKNLNEKTSPACSSTDALNLLADLALGSSNEQQQANPAPERTTYLGLELLDNTEDMTSADQESILHTLLRHPAARPNQSLTCPSPDCPSPKHPVETTDVDMVGLIGKDHSYSLPPSSSPQLGLPGTPYKVPLVNGSTEFQPHGHGMGDSGIQTLANIGSQEDGSAHDHGTPEYPQKTLVHRRKFQHSRQFVSKDGSIHVTRVWEDDYDFHADSKFTNDLKDKTVIRALHGPWNSTVPETTEEVELIIHMWIGLFYSRSTSRLFHMDSDITDLLSEDSDKMEMSSVMAPAAAESELTTRSSDPLPALTSDTSISQALDLSKKDASVPNEEESKTLDQSLSNSEEETVTAEPRVSRKQISASCEHTEDTEALSILEPSMEVFEKGTLLLHPSPSPAFKYYREKNTDWIPLSGDDRSNSKNRSPVPLEETDCQEHTELVSCKTDEVLISLCEEMSNVCFETENCLTSSGTSHLLHGSETGTNTIKESFDSPESTEMVEKNGIDSSEIVADKGVNSNGESDNGHESKDGENGQLEETSSQDAPLAETTEEDIKIDAINEGSETSHNGVEIPFIGKAASWQDTFLPLVLLSQATDEEVIQSHDKVPSIGGTTYHKDILPTAVYDSSQMNRLKSNQPLAVCKESASDDRCPTPTIDEKPYEQVPWSDPCGRTYSVCTANNYCSKGPCSLLEHVSQRCIQSDPILASVEREHLIFSERMKQLLKRSRKGCIHCQDQRDKSNVSSYSPLTVQFSSLEEQVDTVDHLAEIPPLVVHTTTGDVSESRPLTDRIKEENTLTPQPLPDGTDNSHHTGASGVTAECSRLYEAMMDGVCARRKLPSSNNGSQMEKAHPKPSIVEESCKTKYRFFILVTSNDIIFEKTTAQLEAEGHTAVQPSHFFDGEDTSSTLLIILRNEDIAEHICEVPHLLELKTSPGVLFAGIDEPDDIVNLAHQELFTRGGFIMFDRAALQPLSLCNMRKISEIVQQLNTMGKWKWILHYRDSRWLKETAWRNAEAKKKKDFLTCCQEDGMLEVLPYHECDLKSKDQPNYLTCLVHLQVQHISSRYPVFVTDTTDGTFGKHGILTMTVNSFMTVSPRETFPV
ncbi:uncharacterized protein tasor2 isoform X2 [Genypterus blacodes]|uniref:uncharacterized protein tasor2 isoform X2 n=1 Tax=Genypterus blacodes TaxID=154954 RepID=UPI003F75D65C